MKAISRLRIPARSTCLGFKSRWLTAVFLASPLLGYASDIFVAQNAAGADSGADCANAHSVAWLATAASWDGKQGHLGAGSTAHLCGIFNFGAQKTGVTVMASGTSSNPITIFFEPGAILQSPAFSGNPGAQFGGAILINGFNYIVIDGGTNGIIQNTQDGAATKTCLSGGACTVQSPSVGVYVNNSIGTEVKNLTIQGIYFLASGQLDGGPADGTADIYASGPLSDISIHDNILKDSRGGIWVGFDNGTISGADIYNNTVSHHNWHIIVSNGTGGFGATGVLVHNNVITDWSDWNGAGSAGYHNDGLFFFNSAGSPRFNPLIYDNRVYGDIDGGTGGGTGFLYCTYGTGTNVDSAVCTAFNNVFDNVTGNPNKHCAAAVSWNAIGTQFYNNTLIGTPSCATGNSWGFFINGTGATLSNNIVKGFQSAVSCPYNPCTSAVAVSDHNDWANVGTTTMVTGTGGNYTFAQWRATGRDINSLTSDPSLGPTYVPGPGSPVIGAGANLTGAGISQLTVDAAGTARPAPPQAWTIGAFNAILGGPMPPTNLIISLR